METSVGYGEVELQGCACALCCAAAPQEQTATAASQFVDSSQSDPDQNVDALLTGVKWATTSLTYSFPDSALDFSYDFYSEAATNFSPLNAQQKDAARAALDYFADVSGLTFTELTGAADRNADLTFAESGAPSTAWAYFPSGGDWGGDSWFNRNNYNTPETGNYAFSTFMHEAGHALGLKHGHETSDGGALNSAQDSHEYSIMTYRSYVGSPGASYTNGVWGGPQTPMMYDIAAIQRMYGANFQHEAGDTVYTFSTTTGRMFVDGVGALQPGGNIIFRTIWDGGGEDTYDFSNYNRSIAVDLSPGGFVDLDANGDAQRAYLGGQTFARGHVFNALQYEGSARSLIENAIGGSRGDDLLGNAADNRLEGRGGADALAGAAGDDTLIGGAGGDVFSIAASASGAGDRDVLSDLRFADGDVIRLIGLGSGDAQVSSYTEIARLAARSDVSVTLAANGSTLVTYQIDGRQARVELSTVAFEDIAGAIANVVDTPPEPGEAPAATNGADALTGTAFGDEIAGLGGADTLLGAAGDDTLLGGDGDDVIRGWTGDDRIGGGAGADDIDAGSGDDVAAGGAGADTLKGGVGDDNLSGGAGADVLMGALDDDTLSGGAGNDRLFGQAGEDRLNGQAGDDNLQGGGERDAVLGGLGFDTLQGGDASDTLRGGDQADLVLGQNGNDWLFGDAGADTLVGGAGADAMAGGGGADQFRFFSNNGADRITDFQDGLDKLFIGPAQNFAALEIFDNGGDAVVRYNGGSVRLEGVAAEDLTSSDFIF